MHWILDITGNSEFIKAKRIYYKNSASVYKLSKQSSHFH